MLWHSSKITTSNKPLTVFFFFFQKIILLTDIGPPPEASPVPVPSAAPRITGSMVSHNDDEVTRMKNIEMIELGMHRIRPWYFSPYPQVRFRIVIHSVFSIPKAWFTPVLPHFQ